MFGALVNGHTWDGTKAVFRSFEDLEVWKRACNLAVDVYSALRESRDYGLRDQMQRAAVSIASNIAEGAERGGRDFGRFLRISLGSAAELRTQLYIAYKVQVLDKPTMQPLLDECRRVSRMLAALHRTVDESNQN